MTRVLPGLRGWLRKGLQRASGHDQLATRLSRTEAILKRHAHRLSRLDERLRNQKELFEETRLAAWKAQSLYEILSAQVGAVEERLQDLTEKVEVGAFDATDEEEKQARNLLAEVRDEHRRIRVRFATMTRYEERIRRLESALAEEMAAAAELAHQAAQSGALANAPTHGAVDIPDDPPAARTS
jgi:predicted  nucleic acid-binding Zn-ribbon protein